MMEQMQENVTIDDVSTSITTTVSATQVVQVTSGNKVVEDSARAPFAQPSYSSLISSSSSSSSSSSPLSFSPKVVVNSSTPASVSFLESTRSDNMVKRKRKRDGDAATDDTQKRKRTKLKSHKQQPDPEISKKTKDTVSKQKKRSQKMSSINQGKNAEAERTKSKPEKIAKSKLKIEDLQKNVAESKSSILDAPEERLPNEPQTSHVHSDRLALINGTQRNEVCHSFQ